METFAAISETSSVWKPGQKGTISISFNEGGGAWSMFGSSTTVPSMNLGYVDPPFTSFAYAGKVYQVPSNAVRNNCTGPNIMIVLLVGYLEPL